MLQHKGKIALVLIGLAVTSLLVAPSLPGAMVASLFVIMALALYTIPDPTWHGQGNGRVDPQTRRVADVMKGIGLGLLGAILLIFLPRQLSWLVIGIVAVAAFVYWIRLNK